MKKTNKQETMTFEEALTRLEGLLASLERSDCPLEEAMSLYQEGMSLVRLCRGKLSDAENKISILLKDTQEFMPFTGEEEGR